MATTYIANLNETRYEANPSVKNLQLKTRNSKVFAQGNEALFITNSTTSKVTPTQSGATFIREELVDQEEFIKLYTNGLEHLAQLSGSGFKVFQLVYRELLGKKDIDLISLDFIELKHYGKWKWSKATFNSGVNELVNKQILFRAIGANKYWINVNLFFNGDRINIVKSYKLKKSNTAQPELLNSVSENEKTE